MVVVRPWKLLSKTMISAASGGVPLTSRAHLRAALMAVSTASAPVFIGSARSMRVMRHTSARNGPSSVLWKAREVSVSRPACSTSAATSLGCEWPKLTAE